MTNFSNTMTQGTQKDGSEEASQIQTPEHYYDQKFKIISSTTKVKSSKLHTKAPKEASKHLLIFPQ